jgi:hypothetical protein
MAHTTVLHIPKMLLILLAVLFVCGSCAYVVDRHVSEIFSASKVDRSTPFLKAHLRDGSVQIFKRWTISDSAKAVYGDGDLLDANRNRLKTGRDTIPFSKVVLFETNDVWLSPATVGMTIVSMGSAALSIYCMANPKACFGSCPTFYAWDGERMSLQAEGFTSSVLPSLEAVDIDALYGAKPFSRRFELQMTNEAMETHVIRSANILALPRPEGGRVFSSPTEEFFTASTLIPPSACTAPEGDCTALLRSFDARERFSLADSLDLAEREVLDIRFDTLPAGTLGVVAGFRQTLLPTYLFYQGLAYLGTSASTWMAMCERKEGGVRSSFASMIRVLGGIEVLVQDEQHRWVTAGEFSETGPIAVNVQVLPLRQKTGDPHMIRFRMCKGMWRLDFVALCPITPSGPPVRVPLLEVMRHDTADRNALISLTDPAKVLVTLPGDAYTLIYRLPEDYTRYELFLESRGYYMEWMRQEWLADENPEKTVQMFTRPEAFLKDEAPRFKAVESSMEDLFWRSRYVRHEN